MWSEEDGVWWSKENEARKASAFQKLMKAIGKVNFALAHLETVQVVNSTNTKEKGRILKEKAREMPIHRRDFQLLKIPFKRDLVLFGNNLIGIPNVLMISQLVRGTIQDIQFGWRQFPLNLHHHPMHVVLDLGFTRSIGSRMAISRFQKKALYLWDYD